MHNHVLEQLMQNVYHHDLVDVDKRIIPDKIRRLMNSSSSRGSSPSSCCRWICPCMNSWVRSGQRRSRSSRSFDGLILVLKGPFAATDGSVLLRFLRGKRSFHLTLKLYGFWDRNFGKSGHSERRLHIYYLNQHLDHSERLYRHHSDVAMRDMLVDWVKMRPNKSVRVQNRKRAAFFRWQYDEYCRR
jgi:hypothetical protein